MFKRLNSPLGAALLTAIVIAGFIYVCLSRSSFDWSAFVVAGDQFSDPSQVPAGLKIFPQSDGYDGQFYYRLALDPFTSRQTAFGVTLDNPPYRQQRILYPILSALFSFSRADLIPVTMVAINWICLCVLAWIGGLYAETFKQGALWGVSLALQPAFLFTLSRDLVEILEVTLVLGSLLLLRRGWPLLATVMLSFAVLARETAVVVAVAALLVFAFELWQRREDPLVRWYYFTIPIVVFCLWQSWLFFNWGSFPSGAGQELLGIPFAGPIGFLMEIAPRQTYLQRRAAIELLFLLLFACGVLRELRRAERLRVEVVACLLYGLLAVSLTRAVWVEDWAFFRAASQFCALGAVIAIASRFRLKRAILGGSIAFWIYLAEKLTWPSA